VLTDMQKRRFRYVFELDSEGIMPYKAVLYSCPKKLGKSMLVVFTNVRQHSPASFWDWQQHEVDFHH